ncbi:UBX [Macleaya cordata]|uniref:UBX n=1 Tax=Macleaya cordata TaxID=56857 RepID=A0A200RCN4_MACCD|nr:UBX [Macleaya cordata]
MRIGASSAPSFVKRRRLISSDPMEAEIAKAKLAAIAERLGREIRVFETSTTSSTSEKVSTNEEEVTDDFYEFTAEDYYRTLSKKKNDTFLKTRKIREAEEAARRARITKAVIRVRFPDNYTLEAKFHPSETLQSLIDLLMKVISRPELPFYIYTTPPKKQIKDMSQDFYSAGFAPGAIVYFSYDLPKGDDSASANLGPFLQDEIRSLNGLDLISEQVESPQSAQEPAVVEPSPNVQEVKPAEKKPVKPKWFKR